MLAVARNPVAVRMVEELPVKTIEHVMFLQVVHQDRRRNPPPKFTVLAPNKFHCARSETILNNLHFLKDFVNSTDAENAENRRRLLAYCAGK